MKMGTAHSRWRSGRWPRAHAGTRECAGASPLL